MNLETLEETCLHYLAMASNPLVNLTALYDFCRRDDALKGLTVRELIDFLRRHEQVRLVESPFQIEGDDASEAAEILPRAVLRTRVPTEREMQLTMQEQLLQMKTALERAHALAQEQGQELRAKQIERNLARVSDLQQRLTALMTGKSQPRHE